MWTGSILELLKRLVYLLVGVMLFAVWSVTPIRAQGNTAIIRLDPNNLTVGQGQVEEVRLVVENGSDIYGIDVRAAFDPAVLEIVDADPAKDGVQMISGEFIKPDFVVRNEADNTAGTLQYVVTQVNPTPPANGSGVVLKIKMRGKKQEASSPFTFTFLEMANGRGLKLPIEPQSGTIQGVAPKPETATPRAENTAEPTQRPAATTTRAAAAATRARATAVPANTSNNGRTEFITNAILGVVALGGCLGALAIIGLGIFLVMRKPRTVPPHYPRR